MGILYNKQNLPKRKYQVGGTIQGYKAKDIHDLFYGKYNIEPSRWLNAVGVMTMHEGRGRRSQVQLGKGPGRGAWQIEPESAVTMVNQYKNIAAAHGFKLPKWIRTLETKGRVKDGYNVAILGKPEQLELLMANYAYGEPNKALMRWRDGKADLGELWADGWKKSFKSNTRSKQALMDEINAGDTLSPQHVDKLIFDDLYVDPKAYDNPHKDRMVKELPIIKSDNRTKYRCSGPDCNKYSKGGILYRK